MLDSKEEYATKLNSFSNTGLWYIDQLDFTDKKITISGWAKAPFGDTTNMTFTIDGKEFDVMNYPIIRNDVGKVFWYDKNAHKSGYSCEADFDTGKNADDHDVIMRFEEKNKKYNISGEFPKCNYFSKKIFSSAIPYPGKDQRIRVHGNDVEFSFIFTGYQIFMNCKTALNKIFRKKFDDFNTILDWGCGCGRLTRYLNECHNASVTGVDIDPNNIDWCKQNLNFGSYSTISPFPPTDLKAGQYDLIIGISIFTHLKEANQFAWLKELNRISADDAIVLMSVHGDTAISVSPPTLQQYNKYEDYGFLDVGHDSSLDKIVDLSDYYRAAYHNTRYIEKHWSQYFKIIRILPGYINNHQDLIVMQKRS